MNIIYLISKYVTIIGSVFKGLFEHITCGMTGILVEDGRTLQANELCGHVEHEFTKSKAKTFTFCFLPGVVNALLAFFFGGAGFMGLFMLKVAPDKAIFWVYLVVYYIGVSFACNIFPLYEDALNNWSLIYQQKLTDEEKRINAELKEKYKTAKAFEKESKRVAKQNGSKPIKSTAKKEKLKIKKETNIFTKIILFIPSVIMLAGSFLEKYGLTFILFIILTVLSALFI